MLKLIKGLLRRIRGGVNIKKLKRRGLTIGDDFKMMGGCIIDPSHCWHITIGNQVTLAPGVYIIAHDASTKPFLGYTRVANIEIGDRVFIGAGSIILPGVTVGNDVIIGAGSVVTDDIPSGKVVAGSPAKIIFSTLEYIKKMELKMKADNCFNESYTLRKKITSQMKKRMVLITEQQGQSFVE